MAVKYWINSRTLNAKTEKVKCNFVITFSERRRGMVGHGVDEEELGWMGGGWRVLIGCRVVMARVWRRNKDTQGLRKIEKDSRGGRGQNITNLGGIAPALIRRPAA